MNKIPIGYARKLFDSKNYKIYDTMDEIVRALAILL